jgi:hypothetical protein
MHAPVCRVACWPVSTHAVFSQTDRVRFERLRGPVWSNFMPYEADGRYNRVFDLADEGQEGSPLVHALPVSCGATHTFTRTTPMRGLIHADARTHTVSDMALMQVPHRMHNAPRLHTVGVSTLGIPGHAHGSFRNEKMLAVCAPHVVICPSTLPGLRFPPEIRIRITFGHSARRAQPRHLDPRRGHLQGC